MNHQSRLLVFAAMLVLSPCQASAQVIADVVLSGTATAATNFGLQIREADGTTLIDNSFAVFQVGATGAFMANQLAAFWSGNNSSVTESGGTITITRTVGSGRFRCFFTSQGGATEVEIPPGGTLDGITASGNGHIPAVPSINQWGAIILTVLLAIGGVFYLRRRQSALPTRTGI